MARKARSPPAEARRGMTLFTKFLHCHGRRFAIPLTTSAMCPLSAITERPGGSLARPAVPVRHVERPRIPPSMACSGGRPARCPGGLRGRQPPGRGGRQVGPDLSRSVRGVADTHGLVWFLEADERLSARAREVREQAWQDPDGGRLPGQPRGTGGLVGQRRARQGRAAAHDRRPDAEWIAQLLECGLIRPAFVPPPDIRRLRMLTRSRVQLWVTAPGR
jgi:hypothetical protein